MKGTFGRIVGLIFSVFLVGGALGFLAGMLDLTRNMGFEYTLLGMSAATALYWIVLRGPLGRSVASLLEGEGGSDEMTQVRLEDVEDKVQELALESQRMMELEERLEFTERLLSQHRDSKVEGL
jgi:hypothetical protein